MENSNKGCQKSCYASSGTYKWKKPVKLTQDELLDVKIAARDLHDWAQATYWQVDEPNHTRSIYFDQKMIDAMRDMSRLLKGLGVK